MLTSMKGDAQSKKIIEYDNNMETHKDKEGNEYSVRKLTPRECFRLMDVDDDQIDKIQNAGISESQQYKLAGNSIVVNVLTNIFRKLLIEKGNESQQLSLF